jgi:hypothetical protein
MYEDIKAEFRFAAEELAGTENGKLEWAIAKAMNSLNFDVLGEKYNEAVALLTAHKLFMADPTKVRSGAEVVESQVDNAKTKYADPTSSSSANRNNYSESKWGRQLNDILDACFVEPWVLD